MSRNTVAGKRTDRVAGERDPLDRYYTPVDVAQAVCRRWAWALKGRRVVDPFAGGGAWLEAATAAGASSVGGCDLDPGAPVVLDGRAVLGDGVDFTEGLTGGEVIATNPPFAVMGPAVSAALRAWECGRVSAVIVLGRLTQLEGVSRAEAYQRLPPSHLVIPARRMRWEGPAGEMMAGGTDNFGAAIMLWSTRTPYGETRTAMGWAPDMEDSSGMARPAQVSLFGGAL